jgi:hypothetical protein
MERISRKGPVENEVTGWWEPDGVEDENDEGVGTRRRWAYERLDVWLRNWQ